MTNMLKNENPMKDMFEAVVRTSAEMLNIDVLLVKRPESHRRGVVRVTTREDAITLSVALSASGICAEAASHRSYHGVFI